ncbi:glycosyl hydrolase family 28-related protein [Paenibacillus eucommiae]|uniref:Rhamnogalacturonase A/B/Epimerase-like pectate lyase domain-containing protein n=1 Tax=Paenibacillus eucommiae TaxID=1355755 RepID=A0ABS4IUY0_9BACL|nr:glycosyl hydrolase family 28-related protein [Paenibacillus eucommiae]MBP1991401.1 hypothetical protein [Paenibacillus eucommiae]
MESMESSAIASRVFALNVTHFGAVGDGKTDDTEAFNQAILAADGGGTIVVPKGIYLIDPSPGKGIVLRTGIQLIGEGESASVLTAKPVGGSVIHRDFLPSGPNAYLQDVYIAHIGIVLNHPPTASPGNYEQIGFDFRNVTRSTLCECYVGNYTRGSLHKPPGEIADMIQGYGIVFGSTASRGPAYAGGEVNSAVRCTVWGAKKAIVLDDLALSPMSAAHATVVQNCDIQICELGIGSEQAHTAGVIFENNIVQAVTRARGSGNATYYYRFEGYGSKIEGAYLEGYGPEEGNADGMDADHVLLLGPDSKRNRVHLGYYTSKGIIKDMGTCNIVEYLDESDGTWVQTYNQAAR